MEVGTPTQAASPVQKIMSTEFADIVKRLDALEASQKQTQPAAQDPRWLDSQLFTIDLIADGNVFGCLATLDAKVEHLE